MHLKRIVLHPEAFPTRECYPFDQTIFQQMHDIVFETPVTLFVGENGTGKSTLIEAIAARCGIHIWRDEETRRFERNPHEDKLYRHLRAEWEQERVPGSFFGSDVFRHFTRLLDEWAAADSGQLRYFGGKSLVTQSHGQSTMSYFRTRYRVRGLYLLDEPETALSPRTQLELLQLVTEMSQEGHAQFIIATHSPILLACPGARLYSFDHVPIAQVCYEETSHYRIYRDFMRDRQQTGGVPPASVAAGD